MEERIEKDIHLKSEPMNEMLSRPPSWIVSSGNGLFLIILGLMILLTWLIQYPDEIGGDASLTTSEPPIELSNQMYVQLKSLKVTDQMLVKKGQLIAQFDSHANPSDIKLTKQYLQELSAQIATDHRLLLQNNDQKLQLGAFQESWIQLQSKIANWNDLQNDELLNVKLTTLKNEIVFRQRLTTISNKKISLTESDYALMKEELETSERLVKEKALSRQQFNQDKKMENQASQAVQSQQEQAIQNLIVLNNLKREFTVLKYDIEQQKKQLIAEIRIKIATLQSSIINWEKNEIWLAPCNGKVLFNQLLQENNFYAANKASLVIVPAGGQYIVRAIIPSQGAGKVKKGQKALVELSDFPKAEYGMLEGIVQQVTNIEKEGTYAVKIQLIHQLKTTQGKYIPAKAQLKGKVKIITKNRRLIERFFEKIVDLGK